MAGLKVFAGMAGGIPSLLDASWNAEVGACRRGDARCHACHARIARERSHATHVQTRSRARTTLGPRPPEPPSVSLGVEPMVGSSS